MKIKTSIALGFVAIMFLIPGDGICESLRSFAQTSDGIQVIELRNYLIKPGQRDKFAEFMNRIIIPRQESQGGHVLKQFGLKDGDDNYVWIRGFADMPARSQFLRDFYSSEYWKQNRDETNSMLAGIEYIYLLKPLQGTVPRSELKNMSGLAVIDFYKAKRKRDRLIDLFTREYLPVLKRAGVSPPQLWISEMGKNDFWLPAIQDPDLLVVLTYYQSEEEYKSKLRKTDQLGRAIKARLRDLVTSSETRILYPLSAGTKS